MELKAIATPKADKHVISLYRNGELIDTRTTAKHYEYVVVYTEDISPKFACFYTATRALADKKNWWLVDHDFQKHIIAIQYEEHVCNNCGHCWHSAFNGCVCMDGWGDSGCDVLPNSTCDDWVPDKKEEQQ